MDESEKIELSIVVPAYNEGEAIAGVVHGLKALNLGATEILVVNDGSSDNTAEQAQAAGARVVSHPYNIGNGAAVKSGIRAARGDVIAFLDGDGQHDPNDIPRLLPYIVRYHMVVGARTKESDTALHRDLANFVYNKLASFVAEFDIKDLTSGFRIMRGTDAKRFCDMFPNTFSYPTTSTLAFIRSGRSIKYVGIKARARTGKSKIRLIHDGFEFLIIIMKIAMTFSPLRVFIPISSFLFFLGLGRWVHTYIMYERFTNLSQLLMVSAVIVFMLGLVAEQIASLRMEKGDLLFTAEDAEKYTRFAEQEESIREIAS